MHPWEHLLAGGCCGPVVQCPVITACELAAAANALLGLQVEEFMRVAVGVRVMKVAGCSEGAGLFLMQPAPVRGQLHARLLRLSTGHTALTLHPAAFATLCRRPGGHHVSSARLGTGTMRPGLSDEPLSGGAPQASAIPGFPVQHICHLARLHQACRLECLTSQACAQAPCAPGYVTSPLVEWRLKGVPSLGLDPLSTTEPARGEICIRGPMLLSGFYSKEGAARARAHPMNFASVSATDMFVCLWQLGGSCLLLLDHAMCHSHAGVRRCAPCSVSRISAVYRQL